MPDILLPVAVSQGQPSALGRNPTAAAKAAEDTGFGQLLVALGMDLTDLQAGGADKLSALQGQDPEQALADLLAEVRDGGLEVDVEGLGELPREVVQLLDLQNVPAIVQDLRAFLREQGLVLGQGASLTLSDGALPTPGTHALPPSLSLEALPLAVSDLSEGAAREVMESWLGQLPAALRQSLSRLLEAGNTLPSAAGPPAADGPQSAGQQGPLHQLLVLLQPKVRDGSAMSPGDMLQQALAGADKPLQAASTPSETATTNKAAGRNEAVGLRLAEAVAAGLSGDGGDPDALEQVLSRSTLTGHGQMPAPAPGSSFAPPLTLASGAAMQAGSPLSQLTGAIGLPQAPPIPAPPGDAAWSQALGERVLWMTGRNLQRAEVRLSPANLGPVEIKLSMHNDQATVSFTAQHPFTREALEASLPRLREMFADANINLADVDVGQRDTGESRGNRWNEAGPDGSGEGFAMDGESEVALQPLTPTRVALGLVDDFA